MFLNKKNNIFVIEYEKINNTRIERKSSGLIS